jgi:hypothetical protein
MGIKHTTQFKDTLVDREMKLEITIDKLKVKHEVGDLFISYFPNGSDVYFGKQETLKPCFSFTCGSLLCFDE